MEQVNTIIKKNNVNDNVKINKSNNEQCNNVEAIASQLCEKFESPDSWKFYCKIAYKLPEYMIWGLYEQALTGTNPAGLFNWLCRKEMNRK